MEICVVSGSDEVVSSVRTQCEPAIHVEAIDMQEVNLEALPVQREREVIECLATADGVLFEWDVLRSHLISEVQKRVAHVGVPVIAVCSNDPRAYTTALLAGANLVTSLPVVPAVLEAMVVAHRRTFHLIHDIAAMPVGGMANTGIEESQQREEASKGAEEAASQNAFSMVLLGKSLVLSAQQYQLLAFLRGNANKVVTREEILDAVWGVGFNPGTNVVDVAIHFLRKVLRQHGLANHLQTVRGKGYRLRIPSDHARSRSFAPGSNHVAHEVAP